MGIVFLSIIVNDCHQEKTEIKKAEVMVNEADELMNQGDLGKAINKYQEVESMIQRNKNGARLLAHVYTRMGVCYLCVAREGKDAASCEKYVIKSIDNTRKSLTYYTTLETRKQKGAAYINLGLAYSALATFRDPRANLQNSIDAYSTSFEFINENNEPVIWVAAKIDLGKVRIEYGNFTGNDESIRIAVKELENPRLNDICDKFNKKGLEADLLTTKANAYRCLADISEPGVNSSYLYEAKTYAETSFNYVSYEEDPALYGRMQVNLSIVLLRITPYLPQNERGPIYKEVIGNLTSVLSSTKAASLNRDAAMNYNDLGAAYYKLSFIEDNMNNLNKAKDCFLKSMSFENAFYSPLNFATSASNLGLVYTEIYKFTNSRDDCELALSYFDEALRVWDIRKYPIKHADVQFDKGCAYYDFSKFTDRKTNLDKSKQCFNIAHSIYLYYSPYQNRCALYCTVTSGKIHQINEELSK